MSKSSDDLLSLQIGGASVAEHLSLAIQRGLLIEHADGSFELPTAAAKVAAALYHTPVKHLDCEFLIRFLFKIAYAESAVPSGCQACYKVVVTPKDLRGLIALRAIQRKIDCNAKCGVDVDRTITQSLYSGYFYCITLERAREVYRLVRAAVDAQPKLGAKTPVRIKRGCTEYEINCGPSDQYTFHPDLPELEAYLLSRFRHRSKPQIDVQKERLNTQAFFVQTAYRIGDDTYLDFTGGKPLFPKAVTYDPGPSSEAAD